MKIAFTSYGEVKEMKMCLFLVCSANRGRGRRGSFLFGAKRSFVHRVVLELCK